LSKEQVCIELTVKAEKLLSRMIKVSLPNHHLPNVKKMGKGGKFLCKICYLPIDKEDKLFICNECGELYHKSCVEFVKNNSPLISCVNPSCPSRTKNIPLIQVLKSLT
jgi:hypothetical protein